MKQLLIGAMALFAAQSTQAEVVAQGVLSIVAAENFYGEIAQTIGGTQVAVTSILSNPNQDPHLFEASPSTARAVAHAHIVIVNGAAYDPWMDRLLEASPNPKREVLNVASVTGHKRGDNPHLWYDPATMPAVARVLTARLTLCDPPNANAYRERHNAFIRSLVPLTEKVTALKSRFAGTPVTATEPVFGYMASALGLEMRNDGFQLAIMNGTEPSPRQVAAFESSLRDRTVKVLIYNSQVSDDTTSRLKRIADEAGVPVVGVTETMPAGKTYVQWMVDQLEALQAALSQGDR
ncbi:metal ABC transporter solute-binding protein, Zn/Mn family [Reyranella sp.]|uniref:metal ABC transporter solute-binding protein, Zn/Mn family n=1 Tax=Reyranella sp. TaxID=1929291 RepID=UPI003BADBD1A